jgi:hypothetical protein
MTLRRPCSGSRVSTSEPLRTHQRTQRKGQTCAHAMAPSHAVDGTARLAHPAAAMAAGSYRPYLAAEEVASALAHFGVTVESQTDVVSYDDLVCAVVVGLPSVCLFVVRAVEPTRPWLRCCVRTSLCRDVVLAAKR